MKKLILGSILAAAALIGSMGIVAMTANAICNPAALGGTGTCVPPTSGQILIGNGVGSYTPASLIQGANMTITTGSGTISLASTGGTGGSSTVMFGVNGVTTTALSNGVQTSSLDTTFSASWAAIQTFLKGMLVNGTTTLASSTNCGVLKTDSSGNVSCGTAALSVASSATISASASTGSGISFSLIQSYITAALQSLNGATSSAQTIVAGTGESVTTAAGSGNSTTTITNTGVTSFNNSTGSVSGVNSVNGATGTVAFGYVGDGTTVTSTISGATTTFSSLNNIAASVNYYVCGKGASGTCVYNGDGGTVATPADTNDCMSKSTPCKTVAGVESKIHGKRLTGSSIVTINLADTANSGSDCYVENNTTFSNPTTGRVIMSQGRLDTFPSSYIYVLGDTASSSKVTFAGSSCGSTTFATSTGESALIFDNTIGRVNGVQAEGYGSLGTGGEVGAFSSTGGSMLYVENAIGLGNVNNQAALKAALVGAQGSGSRVAIGQTLSVQDGMALMAASEDSTGYTYDPSDTPTAMTNVTYTCATGETCRSGITALGGSSIFTDRWYYTVGGGGTFTWQFAQLYSHIEAVEVYAFNPVSNTADCNQAAGAQKCTSGTFLNTLNAANYKYEASQEGSFIDDDCTNSTTFACTVNRQPNIKGVAIIGGFIRDYSNGGSVTQVFTNTYTTSAGGCVSTFNGRGTNNDYATCDQESFLMTASSTGSQVTIIPASSSAAYNLTLPTSAGTSGQLWTSGGGGTSPNTWTTNTFVSSSSAVTWSQLQAFTSGIQLGNASNSLALLDSSGNLGNFAGSNCGGGQFQTGVSATGTALCSTPAGSGNVSSATTTVSNNFPFWSASNQLSGTSTLTISGSAINQTGTLAVSATSTTAGLIISGLSGTQCLHEISGTVSGSGADCGSGSAGVPLTLLTSTSTNVSSTSNSYVSIATSSFTLASSSNVLVTVAGVADGTGTANSCVFTLAVDGADQDVYANGLANTGGVLSAYTNVSFAYETALLSTSTHTINLKMKATGGVTPVCNSAISSFSVNTISGTATTPFGSTSTKSLDLNNFLPDNTGEVYYQPFATSSIGGPANGLWPFMATSFGSSAASAETSSVYVYGKLNIPEDYVSSSQIIVPWTAATSSGVAYWNMQYRNVCNGTDLDSTTSTESVSVSSTAPATKNFMVKTTIPLTPANLTAGCVMEYKLGIQGASTTVNTISSTIMMIAPKFKYTNY